jgi:hypothetical protein
MKHPVSYTNKMSFFKNGEQKEKTDPFWGLEPVRGDRMKGKSVGG